jgi:hypothetical protein
VWTNLIYISCGDDLLQLYTELVFKFPPYPIHQNSTPIMRHVTIMRYITIIAFLLTYLNATLTLPVAATTPADSSGIPGGVTLCEKKMWASRYNWVPLSESKVCFRPANKHTQSIGRDKEGYCVTFYDEDGSPEKAGEILMSPGRSSGLLAYRTLKCGVLWS